MTRSCSQCGEPITRHSKTGLCKPCATRANRADPEKEARRVAGVARKAKTPEFRNNQRRARLRLEAERRDDPVWKAKQREHGRRLRASYDADPAARAANLARRAAVGAMLSAQRLAWCPPEKRDHYQVLRKRKGAAVAKAIIMDAMTPFERQLARVRMGAKLVAAPDTRPTGPAYSLIGNATGMI